MVITHGGSVQRSTWLALLAVIVAPLASSVGVAGETVPVYERDVRPMLAARCLGCHGGVTRKAGLDLRTRESIQRGSKKGSVLTPGQPDKSTLWKVVHEDRMPAEEPRLTQREKDLLRRWIGAGAHFADYEKGKLPSHSRTPAQVAGELDLAINDYLHKKGLESSTRASDAELLRRLYLDLTGRIPTAKRVAEYLADRRKDKVERVIDHLLQDPQHAEMLAEVWHNAIVPLDLNRRIVNQPFVDWLASRTRENQPWNDTVQQMLAAKGHSLDHPELGFYQAHRRANLMGREATRIFLGVRLECVQCHDHPFAKWTQADYWATSVFFSHTQVKREAQPRVGFLVSESDKPLFGASEQVGTIKIPSNAIQNVGQQISARFLDGSTPALGKSASYRQAFADWATTRDNPYLARATVNRLWAHFFGHGFVHPIDDLAGLESPTVPKALDLLAAEFAASNFDIRHLIRSMVSTQAYQRSARPTNRNERDDTGLSHRRLRPMTAARLYDSLCVALELREIDLAPEKASLGTTARERFINLFNSQDAEEESKDYSHGVLQALRLINGRDSTPDARRLRELLPADLTTQQAVEHLYLRMFSRLPSDAERKRITDHVARQSSAEEGLADVLWTLLNSIEFLMGS